MYSSARIRTAPQHTALSVNDPLFTYIQRTRVELLSDRPSHPAETNFYYLPHSYSI